MTNAAGNQAATIGLMMMQSTRNLWRTSMRIVAVAIAYLVAARIGLRFDPVSGFATLVWPASGIALAAILLGGYALWPAIAIGAFTANVIGGAPIVAALGIAVGNTAEGLLGAYLVRRTPGFRCELDRVRDVLALILLAVLLSPVIAATVGATMLVVTGVASQPGFGLTWKAWWLGDAIGNLLAAPLILVWLTWARKLPSPARIFEILALGATILGVCLVVFGPEMPNGIARGREYILFPPLIWASLRFGVCGAVTSSVIVAISSIIYTAGGHGPFSRAELHENLLALQTFIGISGATFLVLGASISERRKTEVALRAARETAETANRAKSGFLAVVSHELRTPLNAIMGYVELLLLELDGPLTHNQRAVLERVRQSQRHLLSLIDDVLGFAQVEAGRLTFVLQPVSVGDLFASIEAIVSPEAARREVNLATNADPSLRVSADPDKLRQVLLNLVTNAIKFTSAGGSVSMSSDVDRDRAILTVSDTGIGISRENLSRVFDPFFQVDQGGTRRYPGVGLGLSIVRDAVLAMNGDVSIDSEPGKGTSVNVILPLAPSDAVVGDGAPSFSSENSRETSLA